LIANRFPIELSRRYWRVVLVRSGNARRHHTNGRLAALSSAYRGTVRSPSPTQPFKAAIFSASEQGDTQDIDSPLETKIDGKTSKLTW